MHKGKKYKKLYVTLIEVLIAMSLFSILLASLFNMYWRVNKIQLHADVIKEKVSEQNFAYTRLSKIIPTITLGVDSVGRFEKNETKEFFFFAYNTDEDGRAIEFIYDNGATLLPKFSSYAHGKLFVERGLEKDRPKKKSLWLETKPSPAQFPDSKEEVRREKILDNVERVNFKFILPEKPEDKDDTLGQGNEEGQSRASAGKRPDGEETSDWSSKEWKMLPAMIQMEITRTKEEGKELTEPLKWTFYLPNSNHKVTLK